MTIVNFYRVVKTTRHTATFEHIGAKYVDGSAGWSGHVVADPDTVKSAATFTRRLHSSGYVRGHNSSNAARKWDGKPVYFNHMD